MIILFYITKVFVASGILFGYYWLFLRNKKFHHYNRFYLLAALIIPPVISFISIPVFSHPDNTAKEVLYQTITTLSAEPLHLNTSASAQAINSGLSWKELLMPAYLLVCVGLFFILLRTLFYIFKLRRKYPFEAIKELKIYNTGEPGTPFSFFQSIFWNRELVLDSKEGQQIFRHELFHVQQKHSADILFAEILASVLWINPFYHLIKKELRAIHEFLADQYAVKNEDCTEYAQLLLQNILKSKTLPGTNYFFQNHIKRRIAMITQLKKRKYSYWSRLMVLPVTVLLFCGIALYAGQSPNQKTKANPVTTENSQENIKVDTIPMEERKKLESELKELQAKKLKMLIDQQTEMEIINQKQQLLLERLGEEREHTESTLKKQKELLNEQEMLERKLQEQRMGRRNLAEIEALNQKLQLQEKSIGKEKLIELQNLQIQLQKEQGEQVQKDKYWQEKIQLLNEKEQGQMNQKTLDKQATELLDKIAKQKIEEQQLQQLKTGQLQILIEQKEKMILESKKNAQEKLLKLYKEKISRQYEDEIKMKEDKEATREDTIRISPDEFEKYFVDNLTKKNAVETSVAFGNVYLKIKDDSKVYYITQAEFTALKEKNKSIQWEKEYDKIFTKVEIEPQFPGGENAWNRYLDNNIKNPMDASGKKMQGLVELQFIIDKEGNIIYYRVIGGNSAFQEEAIRLLMKSGQWNPAMQNGHKVKAYKKQVIVFGDVPKEVMEKANESTSATINN